MTTLINLLSPPHCSSVGCRPRFGRLKESVREGRRRARSWPPEGRRMCAQTVHLLRRQPLAERSGAMSEAIRRSSSAKTKNRPTPACLKITRSKASKPELPYRQVTFNISSYPLHDLFISVFLNVEEFLFFSSGSLPGQPFRSLGSDSLPY